MPKDLRVMLADDHPLMLKGIRAALVSEENIEIVAEANDGVTMQDLCRQHLPDILIMDINMPGPGFQERIAYVQALEANIKVLILSAFNDPVYVQAVIKAGVEGYILKDEVSETLAVAIRTIAKGSRYFGQKIIKVLADFDYKADAFIHLTSREKEVLAMVAKGLNNKAIAEELAISDQTVRNYVSTLYDKLGISSRVELVLWSKRHGLGKES